MNESIAECEALWDEFLQRWPLENLALMTLEQYAQVGSQDAFVYWIEAKTGSLGSIWGGSSFKFGVYGRRDRTPQKESQGRRYDEHYG
ncbi:hypothetical protein ANRL3_01383 [Anaerolineae bacterium]|nr:hypothetical protein ANRL3_01383 [Anaerolineae bacterium]